MSAAEHIRAAIRYARTRHGGRQRRPYPEGGFLPSASPTPALTPDQRRAFEEGGR